MPHRHTHRPTRAEAEAQAKRFRVELQDHLDAEAILERFTGVQYAWADAAFQAWRHGDLIGTAPTHEAAEQLLTEEEAAADRARHQSEAERFFHRARQ